MYQLEVGKGRLIVVASLCQLYKFGTYLARLIVPQCSLLRFHFRKYLQKERLDAKTRQNVTYSKQSCEIIMARNVDVTA